MAYNGTILISPDHAAAHLTGLQPSTTLAHDIGRQVESMILDAKHQSESKVGKEIQKVKVKMDSMSEKITTITDRLSRLEPSRRGLLKADILKSIDRLDDVWNGAFGTLKQELCEMINAHNHNADLLKHHKEAIDQVKGLMQEIVPDPEFEQAQARLMLVDKAVQKELSKESQIEALLQRIIVMQQSLYTGPGHWPSTMPLPFPMSQAAAAESGKKTQWKVPKSGKTAKASSALLQATMASLRAEAPEFVPTSSAW